MTESELEFKFRIVIIVHNLVNSHKFSCCKGLVHTLRILDKTASLQKVGWLPESAAGVELLMRSS